MSDKHDTPRDPSSPLRGEGSGGSDAPTSHPAKFSPEILETLQVIVDEWYQREGRTPTVLDCFAGVGLIHTLYNAYTLAVELEPEWAAQSMLRGTTWQGDFFDWPRELGVDMIITSPTYGNRMADHHEAKDTSKRMTYKHQLGRDLSEGSSAGMQWGTEYREFHQRAWERCWDLLPSGGLLIINIKDHIRGGEKQPVTAWHRGCAKSIGFKHLGTIPVKVKGMGFGANRDARIDHENIIVLEKP